MCILLDAMLCNDVTMCFSTVIHLDVFSVYRLDWSRLYNVPVRVLETQTVPWDGGSGLSC
jgi:hypothetical protein